MALEITEALLQTELRSWIGDDVDSFADRRLHRACISGLERLGRRRCWSFHRDTYPCATIVPYSTGDATVAIGGTSVTIGTGTIPTDAVGAWIEFDGQRRAYEITVRTSGAALTIRNAYANADATNLAAVTYKIFYPSIDLPANFRSLRKVIDDGRNSELEVVDVDEIDKAHASSSGVGAPYYCALRAKRSDPNIMQLFLYPAPNTQEVYTVLYNRTPGWYSTSTVATTSFSLEPTTTAYYVDWPKQLKSLLLASCKISLISEGVKGIDANSAYQDYHELLAAAEADDERQPEIEYLGQKTISAIRTFRIGV